MKKNARPKLKCYFEAVLRSTAKKDIKGNHCICEYNEWHFGKKIEHGFRK